MKPTSIDCSPGDSLTSRNWSVVTEKKKEQRENQSTANDGIGKHTLLSSGEWMLTGH